MFSDKIYIVFVAFNLVLRLIYLNNDDTNDSIKKLKTGLVFRSLQKKMALAINVLKYSQYVFMTETCP